MKTRIALPFLALLIAGGCVGGDVTSPASDVAVSANRSRSEPRRGAIAFEKWFTTAPFMTGNTSYGDGTFSGKILGRTVSADGTIVSLVALYTVTDPKHPRRSFTAQIAGDESLVTKHAVLTGYVIDGWRKGTPVLVNFDIIAPCALAVGPSVPNTCFKGTIRVHRQDED
jgi:hypothetical protein